MGNILCSACHTEYPDTFEDCPVCGHREEPVEQPQEPEVPQPEPVAPAEKPRPKAFTIVLVAILSVLVLAGGAFIIYNIGYKWNPVSTMGVMRKIVPSLEAKQTEQPAAQTAASPESYTNEEDQSEQTQQETPEKTVACTGITLGTNTITFEEAEQFYNMTVQLSPNDCTQSVSFVSMNPSIATVNDNGKIVAISGGSTEIVVSCGDLSENCLVTCDFSLAAGEEPLPMKLNNDDMTFFTVGEQFALEVENLPHNATVSFESSNKNVASVSDKGVVTATGSGTATITATVGDTKLTCIVRCNVEGGETTVVEDPNCTISHSDVTMSVMNEYFKLNLKDSGGHKITGIIWKSSNSAVCTVDENGTVTAVGRGTATVSTVYGGATYQCIVRCNIG